MKILFEMSHGLGDNAQLTIGLKHIKKYHPNWIIDIEVGVGKESFFIDFARNIYTKRSDRKYDLRFYDNIHSILWERPEVCLDNAPTTKVTAFLQYLKIKPDLTLYNYQVHITSKDKNKVEKYLSTLPHTKFVLLHYIAKTFKEQKNLPTKLAQKICKTIIKAGYIPIILDWKSDCCFYDQEHIFCPDRYNTLWNEKGHAAAGTLAALIEKAKLYIGIDSGPAHVAGATNAPTIIVWREHHPVNFYDLPKNVLHLVPKDHKKYIQGKDPDKAEHFFLNNYHFTHYDYLESVSDIVKEKL